MVKRIDLVEGLYITYSVNEEGKALADIYLHAEGEACCGALAIQELKPDRIVGRAFRERFVKIVENNESQSLPPTLNPVG